MTRSLNSLALAVLALCTSSATFASTPAYTFGATGTDITTNINFGGMQPKNEIGDGTSSPSAQQHLSTDIIVSTYIHGANVNVDGKLKIAAQGSPVGIKVEVERDPNFGGAPKIDAGGVLTTDEVEFDLAVAALTAKGITVMAAASADAAPVKNALAAKGPTAKNADASWASTAIAALVQNAETAPLTAADWDLTGANSVDMGLVARNMAGAHESNLLAA